MIILSAGHYPDAPGACHGEFCEHGEATIWVDWIARRLRGFKIPVSILTPGKLGGKVRQVNAIHKETPVALAIEVHFNSATYAGKGSETLYCPGSAKGELAANRIQGALASLFPPNRGVHEGWYQLDRPGVKDYEGDVEGDEVIDYFLRKTACTALIIEPEFVQRHYIIQAKRDAACDLLAAALRDLWLQLKED